MKTEERFQRGGGVSLTDDSTHTAPPQRAGDDPQPGLEVHQLDQALGGSSISILTKLIGHIQLYTVSRPITRAPPGVAEEPHQAQQRDEDVESRHTHVDLQETDQVSDVFESRSDVAQAVRRITRESQRVRLQCSGARSKLRNNQPGSS